MAQLPRQELKSEPSTEQPQMAQPPKPGQSKSAPVPGRDANPGGMKPINPAGVGKGKPPPGGPRGPPKPKPPPEEKKKMRLLDKGFKDDEPEGWDDDDDEEEEEDLEEHVEPIYESIGILWFILRTVLYAIVFKYLNT